MPMDIPIAFDRVSVRRIDQDGHLFIEEANISAACVSPYNATEIPDWEKLGLKAGQVYQLYRDADSLAASAKSFAGKPLLFRHKPVSAEDHPHDIVVGAIGNDVRFEDPFLKASLSIWSQEAIDAIESGAQSDLSCGYYYECVMDSGVYKGTPFQGKMMSITGNHCALVTEGRVPGAFVGDSAIPLITVPDHTPEATPALPPVIPQEAPSNIGDDSTMPKANVALSRQALFASGAIQALLRPKLAEDTKIDLKPILRGVTGRNWKAQRPKVQAALDAALKGKLAQDADLGDIADLLNHLDDLIDGEPEEPEAAPAGEDAEPDEEDDDDEEAKKKKAKEAAEKLKEAAADSDDDDDDKAMDADKDDDDDDDDKKKPAFLKDKKGARDKSAKDRKAMDSSQPTVTKAAMDAAIAQAVKLASDSAAKAAEKATMARLKSIADAEKAVRPYIGEVSGMDSAEAVYRLALDANAVDLSDVPAAAFPALVRMLPLPADQQKQAAKPRIAADSAMLTARSTMFPNANRLRAI